MGNVTPKFTIHAREFVKIVCASEDDAVQIWKVAQKRAQFEWDSFPSNSFIRLPSNAHLRRTVLLL